MKNKIKYLFLSFVVFALVCIYVFAQNTADKHKQNQNSQMQTIEQSSELNYKPENGYVPDEQTAISIAVAVWIPIYGKGKIENEKPYKASLKDGVWKVTGSLPQGHRKGGTAIAEISKEDGRILRVIHEK